MRKRKNNQEIKKIITIKGILKVKKKKMIKNIQKMIENSILKNQKMKMLKNSNNLGKKKILMKMKKNNLNNLAQLIPQIIIKILRIQKIPKSNSNSLAVKINEFDF